MHSVDDSRLQVHHIQHEFVLSVGPGIQQWGTDDREFPLIQLHPALRRCRNHMPADVRRTSRVATVRHAAERSFNVSYVSLSTYENSFCRAVSIHSSEVKSHDPFTDVVDLAVPDEEGVLIDRQPQQLRFRWRRTVHEHRDREPGLKCSCRTVLVKVHIVGGCTHNIDKVVWSKHCTKSNERCVKISVRPISRSQQRVPGRVRKIAFDEYVRRSQNWINLRR